VPEKDILLQRLNQLAEYADSRYLVSRKSGHSVISELKSLWRTVTKAERWKEKEVKM
jgi:hypothetical protein